MSTERDLNPPRKSKSDLVHALVRAGLGGIPIAGGAAVELFSALIAPPLERRRSEWMESIGEALQELQNRGVSLEDLQNDDAFLDTVLQASRAAMTVSNEEKRAALRAAVMNAALEESPDESVQQMFIRWVEEFTPLHLRVLRLFNDPPEWFQRRGEKSPELYMGSLSSVLEAGVPELRGRRPIYDQIWNDLRQRGLVNTDGLHTMMTGAGSLASRTTELGGQFVEFIESPI